MHRHNGPFSIIKLVIKLTVIIFTAAALLIPSPARAAMSIGDVTDGIKKHYEETRDFKARFVQEAAVASLGQTIREEGIVFIKKPARMLWNYSIPADKKIVVNPEWTWLYLPQDKTAYRYSSQEVLKSKVVMKFLTGLWSIGDDFSISFTEGKKTESDGRYCLTLEPKVPDMGIKELLVAVDGATFSIVRMTFVDLMNNKTDLSFSDIVANSGLSDDLFHFTPPQGVEIYGTD